MKARPLLLTLAAVGVTGCSVLPPVKNEIPLVGPGGISRIDDPTRVKVLIFNASNPVWSGSNSGKDIWLDGKGVGRIETGQYVELVVPKGSHTLKLLHQDLFDFYSTHEIKVSDDESIIEICSTATSNKARVLRQLPDKFKESFASMHEPSPTYWSLRSLPLFDERLRIERMEQKRAFCYW